MGPSQATMRLALAVGISLMLAGSARRSTVYAQQTPGKALVHTVITSGCSKYFDWQVMGLVYSFKRVGQQGPLTRLMPCTKEELAAYTPLDVVDTYIAPSFAQDSGNNDSYPPYNKPGAVTHWLRFAEPEEPYILVLDSDIILRKPYVPQELRVRPGWATAPYFDFLYGVNNQLAQTHLPGAAPYDDTFLGPKGRLADMAGAPYFLTKEDLKLVAPLWSAYARKVRNDATAWNLTGDMHAKKPGDKPWIAEMYGYVFGAAKANVRHNPADYFHWMYPGYFTSEPPRILHYGLLWEVKDQHYFFDKAWFREFDPTICPPWQLSQERPMAGLFPLPPRPSHLHRYTGHILLKLLLAIEPVVVLNAALCERHLRHCPPSEQLLSACQEVADIEHELDDALDDLEPLLRSADCKDDNVECSGWAKGGYCETNPTYMLGGTDLGLGCRKSCRRCHANAQIETRSRLLDEVLDAGGSQGRSRLDPLLAAARRERQGWAARLAQRWRGAKTQEAVHVKRQPRPVPRLQADLAALLASQAQASIGNVRVKLRSKKQAAALGLGDAVDAAAAGAGQRVTLRVQAREGSSALQRYAAQLRLSDAAGARRALARLRWLTLSIGAVWGLIILAFLSFLRRQGWLDGGQAAGKDSKSTV